MSDPAGTQNPASAASSAQVVKVTARAGKPARLRRVTRALLKFDRRVKTSPDDARAWNLDGHQRWGLGFFFGLLVGIAIAAQTLLFLLNVAASPQQGAINMTFLGVTRQVPLWVEPWLKIALMAALGMMLNRLFVVGYRAFNQKDFDAESIPYHVALIVQSPFIVVGTLGLGAIVLPAGLQATVPAEVVSPLVLGLAFFFGYYSDDVLEVVHRKLLGAMGREVQPRVSVVPKLEGTDLPVRALADVTGLAKALGMDVEELRVLVEKLEKEGFTYTHSLVARLDARHVKDVVAATGVHQSKLERLVDFADVLRGAGSMQAALEAFQQGNVTNGRDAAGWIAKNATDPDAKRFSAALLPLLTR